MNNVSTAIEKRCLNRLWSAVLEGGLLNEVGIRYVHVEVPEHTINILVASNGKTYWQDFTPPGRLAENYTEITPDMTEGDVHIAAFADNANNAGLNVRLKSRILIRMLRES